MNMKVFIAALSGVVAFSAQAADMTGIYVQGKLGASVQQQSNRDAKVGIVPKENFGSETKAVFAGGLVGGYNFKSLFNIPVRLELEYVVRSKGKTSKSYYGEEEDDDSDDWLVERGKDSFDVNNQSLMLNGVHDIDTGTAFRPYIMAGIGIAHNKLKYKGSGSVYNTDKGRVVETGNASGSGSKTRFAWGVGVGLAYDIDKNWSVDLGYRFLDAGKASTKYRLNVNDGDIGKRSASAYGTASTKVRYHDILLGVRYSF